MSLYFDAMFFFKDKETSQSYSKHRRRIITFWNRIFLFKSKAFWWSGEEKTCWRLKYNLDIFNHLPDQQTQEEIASVHPHVEKGSSWTLKDTHSCSQLILNFFIQGPRLRETDVLSSSSDRRPPTH